jgi:acetyl-CoA carboxylase biotin carboxylase subunit
MKRALSEFQVGGIQTTIPFFEGVMENEDFQKGNFDTHFLERVNK